MRRNVSLEEISDGKLYGSNDMVRADCGDCRGCSQCCHGMGQSVILDPYDVWRLTCGLSATFAELMEDKVELNVVDGVILPNLRMDPAADACGFLDGEGRCSIHTLRPGICRLFPLGRYYLPEEEASASGNAVPEGMAPSGSRRAGEFRYFLQVHECPMPNRTKIKVSKWIDTPRLAQYEAYIRRWHCLLEEVGSRLPEMDEEQVKNVNIFLLKLFFLKPYTADDFYPQFEARMAMAEEVLS